MELCQDRSRKDGNTVETKDFIVAQATNRDIHVFNRKAKSLVLHISCTAMFSPENLQSFADWFQAANNQSIESTIEAMSVLT